MDYEGDVEFDAAFASLLDQGFEESHILRVIKRAAKVRLNSVYAHYYLLIQEISECVEISMVKAQGGKLCNPHSRSR